MSDLPPLNALRAFDAAGRRLSFRAAAEELGVTQGAVAQHVRQLEAHLGLSLFDRVPKGVAFTSAGRSYHAQVSQAFAGLRAATQELRPEPGKVLISVTPTFASKWLIPNLPDFTAAHPEVDLRILATETVSSFHSDGIDLAVRQGAPPFGAALQATLLFRQDVIAVAAPSLVASHRAQVPDVSEPDVLQYLPKIHDTHDLWPGYLAAQDMPSATRRGLRLSQTALAVDAAVAGQGVALVSRFLVAQDLKAGRLVQLGEAASINGSDFYLLMQRATQNRSAVRDVVAWLMSHCALG
ncbi:LysR substrate-binding domain-containing protein [Roseobacteraceae bacterium S113]